MAKSFAGLKADALVIKNEVEESKNTATRIGTMFSDVVEKMENVERETIKQANVQFVGNIVNNLNDGGATKALSAEMGKELATTRRSGLTDSPELNKLLLELYIDPTSYPTGKTWKDISKVIIAKGYNVGEEYINSLYVYFGDDVITIFRNSFSTLDAARSNATGLRGSINKAYIDFSTIPPKNDSNYFYTVQFNIEPTIESAPTIYALVKAKEFEADIAQNKTDIAQNKIDIAEPRYKTVSTPEILYSIDDFIEGYYIKANTIGGLPVGPLEGSGYAYKYVDVLEGEEWTSFLDGGSNGRAWAFLDEKGVIVDFSDTGIAERTVVVPSGVRRILFQTSYSNSNKAKYYVKRPERVSTLDNLEKRVSEIEPLIFHPAIKDIPFSDGAYTTVVGSESVKVESSQYICTKISGIKEGETVEYAVHGGATHRGWAKIFKGVVVSIGKGFEHDTGTVVCDGSFDEMVFNFYKYYVNKYDNYVLYHTTETAVEEVKRMVANLEGELRTDLKILCFGNSFTQDSMSYVPSIIRNIAPNVNLVLGIAFIGGAPLAQHYANFANTDVVINGITYSPENYSYHKSLDGSAWATINSSLDSILADEKWDVITFQQAGGSSAKDYDIYYAPYINKIHKLLFDKLSHQIKIGWLSIHGTYNRTDEELLNHWTGTVANTREVVENTGTSVVFPYGTAVQNLRTVPEINELGDTGHLLADGGHLQDGIGCLCAAYCNSLKILELLGLNYIGIIGETTRISVDFLDSINVPGRNLGESGTVIGMTEDYVYLAQIAATKAILKPYEVTDINANVV